MGLSGQNNKSPPEREAAIRIMCWLGKLPTLRILNELRPIESSIELDSALEFH